MDWDSAVGMHNPFTMEPPEQRDEVDDTRREDEPGDWCIADFTEQCSRGREQFVPGATIRADSDGGWECKGCVDDADHDRFIEREYGRGAA